MLPGTHGPKHNTPSYITMVSLTATKRLVWYGLETDGGNTGYGVLVLIGIYLGDVFGRRVWRTSIEIRICNMSLFLDTQS